MGYEEVGRDNPAGRQKFQATTEIAMKRVLFMHVHEVF
jgi:hypothetical protein